MASGISDSLSRGLQKRMRRSGDEAKSRLAKVLDKYSLIKTSRKKWETVLPNEMKSALQTFCYRKDKSPRHSAICYFLPHGTHDWEMGFHKVYYKKYVVKTQSIGFVSNHAIERYLERCMKYVDLDQFDDQVIPICMEAFISTAIMVNFQEQHSPIQSEHQRLRTPYGYFFLKRMEENPTQWIIKTVYPTPFLKRDKRESLHEDIDSDLEPIQEILAKIRSSAGIKG